MILPAGTFILNYIIRTEFQISYDFWVSIGTPYMVFPDMGFRTDYQSGANYTRIFKFTQQTTVTAILWVTNQSFTLPHNPVFEAIRIK